jgi:hypothetical protein
VTNEAVTVRQHHLWALSTALESLSPSIRPDVGHQGKLRSHTAKRLGCLRAPYGAAFIVRAITASYAAKTST